VNVSTVAEYFGGGGHKCASGCSIDGPLAVAVSRIVERLRAEAVLLNAELSGRTVAASESASNESATNAMQKRVREAAPTIAAAGCVLRISFLLWARSLWLVGADEPRYAQVAREMLERSDWVTPTLQGKPWLEKPVLYYWEAMLSFRVFGVSRPGGPSAGRLRCRLAGCSDLFFLRRFRPGSELDGALITASCAGVIGFAHAAATDMPLAACFAIALLGWYAWYESRRHAISLRFIFFWRWEL
jgi:hypothetical protein